MGEGQEQRPVSGVVARDRRAAQKAIKETQDEVKATMDSLRLEEERRVDEALSL